MQSEVHLEIFGVWGNRERKYLLTQILIQGPLHLVEYLIDAGYYNPVIHGQPYLCLGKQIFVFRQTVFVFWQKKKLTKV